MYKRYRILVLFNVIFFSLFINQKTFSKESFTSDVVQNKIETIRHINHDGLTYDIHKTDPVLLANYVKKMRESYIHQQDKLEKLLNKNRLNFGDAIIAVIIPGGLIYAGYRMNKIEKEKKYLLAVNAEIKELSNDLVAFRK